MRAWGKRVALLLCTLLLLGSAGCLGAHSLDRYGYVLAIGFDEGKEQPYAITLALQNTSASADGGTEGGFVVVKAECGNLFEAIETLSGSLPYQLDFARTALVVVSRAIATREGGMDTLFMTAFSRLRIRYNANLMVALDDANEVITGLTNDMEKNLTRMQTNFTTYSKLTGLAPVANIALFYEACWQHGFDAVVPVCGTPSKADEPPLLYAGDKYALLGGRLPVQTGMETSIAGAALFQNGRMVALIDGRDTQLLLMALNEYDSGRVQIQTGHGRRVSVFLERDALSSTKVTLDGGVRAKISIALKANVENLEFASEREVLLLEAEVESRLTRRLTELFYACRDAGSDAFALGRAAIRHFGSGAAWERYDWHAAYADAEATFLVDVTFRNSVGKTPLE